MQILVWTFRLISAVMIATFWLTRKLGIGLFWLLRRLLRRRPTSHGSARWAKLGDLLRGGVWARRTGLIVGKAYGGLLRHRGEGAVLVYAPMGSGKGVGLVVPNLLDYQGAVICTDPKGENLAVTGRWRATLGPVHRLDAQNPESAHCFNPFDLIRVGTHHETDDIEALADLLIISESSEGHWDTSARHMICMLIGYIIYAKPRWMWTLSSVRQLIALDTPNLEYELRLMADCGNTIVAEEARVTLAGFNHDETRSVIKNTAKALQFWSQDRIGGVLTSRSDFNFLDMHRMSMTVYVVVPEDKLKIYQPFLRVMMGCALIAAVRGKDYPVPEHKPLLLIDECAALGRLEALESGIGYLRAYARTMLILQDLGQLHRIYGQHAAQSFMAASGCQVAFNINDNDTAQMMANALGNATIMSASQGTSQANDAVLRHQVQAGKSESGRALLDPAEIRRLKSRHCIVLMGSAVAFPIRAVKIRFYKVRRWRGRWDVWRRQSGTAALPASASDDASTARRAA
ncbi:type IV secretory system conjugative DNA transfer family protein [Mesorhizobium sp. M0589]|uniref:type IV secretory system conjugative DNA transfer family protein n=1 Tax=Mesorhizobium sp. M0589 TaxID=2956965 RepID=UPI0033376F20